MTSDSFGPEYAALYDRVYSDKDYDLECTIIRQMVSDHGRDSSQTVLDLGCGTGEHAIRLAQQGFAVTGIDRSAPMIERGLSKADQTGVVVDLRVGDLQRYELPERFDAALMMFAVLGYQHANADVGAALSQARQHLRDDGLLLFDVWYGPAVLLMGPETRFKRWDDATGSVLRVSSAELDVRRHTCNVDIQMWRLEGDAVAAAIHETHLMRFFFEQELDLFLDAAGFEVVQMTAFPDTASPPSAATWNILVVARAVAR